MLALIVFGVSWAYLGLFKTLFYIGIMALGGYLFKNIF